MAKEKFSQETSGNIATLTMSRQEARDRIQEQIRKGETTISNADYDVWLVYIRELLRRIVNNDELLEDFNQRFYIAESFEDDLSKLIKSAIIILRSISGKLDLIPDLFTEHLQKNELKKTIGNKVFIVHGHNDGLRETVARFIEKINLYSIILREQPNQGKTIIEKFIEYSDVSFAIVLLTGDDQGGTKSTTIENQRFRARQNVIFELGFFIGKLGREHVCALYEEDVEIPSDYQGVLFLPLDKGEIWKLYLAKELKAAGLSVDMNLI